MTRKQVKYQLKKAEWMTKQLMKLMKRIKYQQQPAEEGK